jgi:hypothetical protein
VRINFVFPNIDNVAFAHGLKVVGSNLFKMSFFAASVAGFGGISFRRSKMQKNDPRRGQK